MSYEQKLRRADDYLGNDPETLRLRGLHSANPYVEEEPLPSLSVGIADIFRRRRKASDARA